MRYSLVILIIALLGCSRTKTNAQPGVTGVWAVDDGEKVRQDQFDHWAKTGTENKVWDGTRISIFGGRNEVVAFQLILEAEGSGAADVNVLLDSLRNGAAVITNTGGRGDPYEYVGKKIELFVEHYQNITDRSASSWSNGWIYPVPDQTYTGLVPDALIPFEAPSGNKAHGIGGAPFDIPAGRNQAVWIDIYVPKNTPPGMYTGTIQVTQGGDVKFTVPISMQVYNFTLPDETHFHSFFHIDYPGIVNRHGVAQGSPAYWDLIRKYMQLGHRHRADLTLGRVRLTTFADNLGGFYDGTWYTSDYHYDGPGTAVGNRMYSIGTYDQPDGGGISGFSPNTQQAWTAAAKEWDDWFAKNAPEVWRFKYMIDEPAETGNKDSNYQMIRDRAGWIHSASGLKTFVATNKLDPALDPSIDYWAVTGQCDGQFSYNIQTADARRSQGQKVGIYNGCYPYFGTSGQIDMPAIHQRINPWIAWKYSVDFFFLWFANDWGDDTGPRNPQTGGPTTINPWEENKEFSWGYANWMYAGEDKLFPGDSRGLVGPISSIRLKNWRRGEQDYEYLWLARQANINTSTIVTTIVPAAFNEQAGNQQAQWAEQGFEFETARRQLAELLVQNGSVGSPPGGTLSASPTSLPAGGGDVTLSWTSTGATTATIDGGIGAVALSGSYKTKITATTSFRMTLANQWGSTVLRAGVTVSQAVPRPSGTLVATPSTLPPGGGNVMLTWSSTGAVNASIDNEIGSVPLNGSRNIYVTSSTTYVLTLTNQSSTSTLSISIVVLDSPPPSGSSNLILNSGFTSGTDSWKFYTDGGGIFFAGPPGYSGSPQSANIVISDRGANVQFYQSNIPLDPDTVYRLTFAAECNTGHGLDVSFLKDVPPFTDYGLSSRHVDLTNTWKTFSMSFRSPALAGSVGDGRLQFWLAPYAVVGDIYHIDNVVLTKGRDTVATRTTPRDYALEQNYPNPFNPSTIFCYKIPRDGMVLLRIYDILGRQVATLVDADQKAGSYQVGWDGTQFSTGVYFYTLQVGSFIDTRKFLLLK